MISSSQSSALEFSDALPLRYPSTFSSAPLLAARQAQCFEQHGMSVQIEQATSPQDALEALLGGRVAAALLPAPLPIACNAQAPSSAALVTTMVVGRSGVGVTLSKGRGDKLPPEPHFAVPHLASMEHLLLRHWLRGQGRNPGNEVRISVLRPEEMLRQLRDGVLDGFAAEEPWNGFATQLGIGTLASSSTEFWVGHPNTVLTFRRDWCNANKEKARALTAALLDACQSCHDPQLIAGVLDLIRSKAHSDLASILGAEQPSIVPALRGANSGPQTSAITPLFAAARADYSRAARIWTLSALTEAGIITPPAEADLVIQQAFQLPLHEHAKQLMNLQVDASGIPKPIRPPALAC